MSGPLIAPSLLKCDFGNMHREIELLEQGGVVVVEWSSRVTELLPVDRIEVQIEAIGENTRRVTIVQP